MFDLLSTAELTASAAIVSRKPKMYSGRSSIPTSSTAPMPTNCWTAIAKVGVRWTGWILPKRAGSVPALPIVYITRDAALVQARPTAIALLINAITTNHQPAPQSA